MSKAEQKIQSELAKMNMVQLGMMLAKSSALTKSKDQKEQMIGYKLNAQILSAMNKKWANIGEQETTPAPLFSLPLSLI